MALVQISQRRGRIDRVADGDTPVVEFNLDPNQTIVSFTCEPVLLFHTNRKTVDWIWKAWVATNLGEPV